MNYQLVIIGEDNTTPTSIVVDLPDPLFTDSATINYILLKEAGGFPLDITWRVTVARGSRVCGFNKHGAKILELRRTFI